jgi:hypothetical protein
MRSTRSDCYTNLDLMMPLSALISISSWLENLRVYLRALSFVTIMFFHRCASGFFKNLSVLRFDMHG